MRISILCILSVALIITGCATVPIQSARQLAIPSALSSDEVKLAITFAVQSDKSASTSPAWMIADNPLQAKLQQNFLDGISAHWSVQDVTANSVILACRQGSHSMSVEYRIEGLLLRPAIVSSIDLKQTTSEIDKDAIEWIDALDTEIERNFASIIAYKLSKKVGS